MVDSGHLSAADPGILSIKARVNHAMLFHHVSTCHIMLYFWKKGLI